MIWHPMIATLNTEVGAMPREHIPAGAKVAAGSYRCNACANEYECREDGEQLPMCQVCSSISWRTRRLRASSKGNEETTDEQQR